jgi:hypothetical protein
MGLSVYEICAGDERRNLFGRAADFIPPAQRQCSSPSCRLDLPADKDAALFLGKAKTTAEPQVAQPFLEPNSTLHNLKGRDYFSPASVIQASLVRKL